MYNHGLCKLSFLATIMVDHFQLCTNVNLLARSLHVIVPPPRHQHPRCFHSLNPKKLGREEALITVEPQLSGARLSWNLDHPAWLKMDMSIAVTMDTGMFIFCACAHALLFINKVGGSRRGLSIRLSIRLSGQSGTKVSG